MGLGSGTTEYFPSARIVIEGYVWGLLGKEGKCKRLRFSSVVNVAERSITVHFKVRKRNTISPPSQKLEDNCAALQEQPSEPGQRFPLHKETKLPFYLFYTNFLLHQYLLALGGAWPFHVSKKGEQFHFHYF